MPIITTLPKPLGLKSYLDEQGRNQVFYWPLTVDETYSVKTWDVFLSGSYDFESYGWEPLLPYSTGTVTHDSVNQALVITNTLGQAYKFIPSTWKLLETDITALNSVGNTVEVVAKFDASSTVPFFNIQVYDGIRAGYLNIYINRVVCGTVSYSMDTTDGYHRYTIVVIDDTLELFVDGVKVASGAPTTVTSHTYPVEFSLPGSPASVSIKYIKIANQPGIPVATSLMDYELQIDTVNTFDSVNVKTHTFSTYPGTTYNSGLVFGLIDSLPERQPDSDYTFYWRIRVIGTAYTSDWSDPAQFTLDQNKTDFIFQSILNSVLDNNAYTKDFTSSNISALLKGEASELSLADFSIIRDIKDLSYLDMRDSTAGQIAGILFGTERSAFQSPVEFRNFLSTAATSFVQATTNDSISLIVKSITGLNPVIIEQNKLTNWQIYTSTTHDGSHFYIKDTNYPGLQSVIRLFTGKGKAYTWQLHVLNPYGVVYNRTLVEDLINKVKPAHTEVYFIYYNTEGAVIINPYYYGEAYYGQALYTDKRDAL